MADTILMRVAAGEVGSSAYFLGDEKNPNHDNQLETVGRELNWDCACDMDKHGKPTSRPKLHPIVFVASSRINCYVQLADAHIHHTKLQVEFTLFAQDPSDTTVGHSKTDRSCVVALADTFIKKIKRFDSPGVEHIKDAYSGVFVYGGHMASRADFALAMLGGYDHDLVRVEFATNRLTVTDTFTNAVVTYGGTAK